MSRDWNCWRILPELWSSHHQFFIPLWNKSQFWVFIRKGKDRSTCLIVIRDRKPNKMLLRSKVTSSKDNSNKIIWHLRQINLFEVFVIAGCWTIFASENQSFPFCKKLIFVKNLPWVFYLKTSSTSWFQSTVFELFSM